MNRRNFLAAVGAVLAFPVAALKALVAKRTFAKYRVELHDNVRTKINVCFNDGSANTVFVNGAEHGKFFNIDAQQHGGIEFIGVNNYEVSKC